MKKFFTLLIITTMTLVINAQGKYAMEEGETYAYGIQPSKDKRVENCKMYFGYPYYNGGTDFNAAVADGSVEGYTAYTSGNGVNGNKDGGTMYIFQPAIDGNITVAVVLNAQKRFFIEEDGTALDAFNGITKEEKYYGTFTFNVKANKTYKIYAAGTKLGFYGFEFKKGNKTESYDLTLTSTGNGYISYNGTTIRNNTNMFSVNEGTSATISFSPDNGYRIKSVKVNNTVVTSNVSNGQYTINNISANTKLEVEFEAIPPTAYTLSIKATGNGSVTYSGNTIRNQTSSFSVNEGTDASISFSPDEGCRLDRVNLNGTDVTSQVSDKRYTISNITTNNTMEVIFVEEDVSSLTVDGVNYKVVSQSDKTVNVTSGSYGQMLTVPASVTSNGKTWTVAGIETDALSGSSELAAVIWNPEATFNATVGNPNLLLYVKSEAYAPASIQNVVVNGTASNIILKESSSGNNFYCSQAFTAQQISYTHNYQMQTGIGESRGWETIALPFDVHTITHETKGAIVPFAQWKSGNTTKPFWLYELTGTGFVEANSIKAYTPYIISMPNNPQYDSQCLLNGKVTFAASGVVVGKTENLNQPTFNNRTFVPCFTDKGSDLGFYALNVNNDYETNNSGMTEGSIFMWKLRRVHPFEAFMTSSSSASQYAFGVFEGMTTGIQTMVDGQWTKEDVVYDLQGRKVENPSKKGVYIVNGKKKIIK